MLVKDNQPDLCQQLQDWFAHPTRWAQLDYRTATTLNKGHGRLERRTVTVSAACGYLDWPDLAQVLHFETRVVHTQTGEVSLSHTYALTSLPPAQASAPGCWPYAATTGPSRTCCTIPAMSSSRRMCLASGAGRPPELWLRSAICS